MKNISAPLLSLIDAFSSNSSLRRTSGSLSLADDWEASSEFPLAIAELSVLDAVLHARQESVARRSAAETRKEKGGLLPFRSSLETTNLFITDPSGGQNLSSSSSRSNTAPLHDLDGSADIISGDILMNNAPTPPQLPTVSLRKLSSSTTTFHVHDLTNFLLLSIVVSLHSRSCLLAHH